MRAAKTVLPSSERWVRSRRSLAMGPNVSLWPRAGRRAGRLSRGPFARHVVVSELDEDVFGAAGQGPGPMPFLDKTLGRAATPRVVLAFDPIVEKPLETGAPAGSILLPVGNPGHDLERFLAWVPDPLFVAQD